MKALVIGRNDQLMECAFDNESDVDQRGMMQWAALNGHQAMATLLKNAEPRPPRDAANRKPDPVAIAQSLSPMDLDFGRARFVRPLPESRDGLTWRLYIAVTWTARARRPSSAGDGELSPHG